MKKIISNINDIGSFDLKKTIRILFWIGVVIIIYTSLRYRHLVGSDIYKYSAELIHKPDSIEMMRSNAQSIDYLKLLEFVVRATITLLAKITILRIGTEFLYIILNGFKSLSNMEDRN